MGLSLLKEGGFAKRRRLSQSPLL